MWRLCLASLLLAVAGSALAADPGPSAPILCHRDEPMARKMWQHMYDVPPNVSALMVAVVDGRLPQVRRRLAAMSSADARRWRQTALLTATWAGHASLVDALLNNGAAVDGKAWMPPLKPRFYKGTVDAMKKSPHFGGSRGVEGLQSTGTLDNRGRRLGPALFTAAACGDAATLRVLLRHHAAVNQTSRPHHQGGDALLYAVMTGDAPSVRVLLDHGAEPCDDDRRMLASYGKHAHRFAGHKKAATVAGLGTRFGLPPALVKRLTCHQHMPAQ